MHRRPAPGALARYDGAVPATLVLVRHGVTHLTEAGALSGGDVPGPSLTTAGRRQAAQAADAVFRLGTERWADLARPDLLVASPMVRTQETAAAIGRRLGVHVTTDERFAEVRFGVWESLTPQEVEETWPGDLAKWVTSGSFAPPEGESYADLGERVGPAVDELAAGTVGRTAVVVAHAAVIRSVIGRALDAPPAGWGRLRVPPCSLSIVRLWPDGDREVTAVGHPAAD
ncbi:MULTISPECIES: histidine phosphatase family protein [Isoptericola]|uniref:Histidine phosphatase family protein n=1 Tax=Isoptericola sediminis TaxID=2733572 RepID=A0A849K171_9MICO|nr:MULTISPECIES: histidine phosphatase family protein [Isoptericola]MDO8145271.1 histidine phosphatase family protein [Isoptericola sp. 178]NNU28494.1 histidine phosphatase family protein [Isoptericola sediminis]